MNLKELNSFKLSDAITFHDKLNPKLWNGTKLRPEVREQLLIIAQDFLTELGVHDLDVKDITISGSNAAFSYTKHSDLDLHILVDMGNLPVDEVYKELFNAKKTIYNDTHDIKIHTIPVELYVQDSRQPVVSLGEYSVMNDQWIKIPTKRRSDFDQTATKSKYEKLLSLIEMALQSKQYSKVKHIIDTIKRYRQAGLDKGGEFGPENLAYKMLRSQGYITKLYDLRDKLHSEILTVETMYQNIDENLDLTSLNRDVEEIKQSDSPIITPLQEINGYFYNAYMKIHKQSESIQWIIIECKTKSGKQVGLAEFVPRFSTKIIIADKVVVHKKYQNQGIASTMYAYAKMLGFDVVRSDEQTTAGKKMWKAFDKSGAAKQLYHNSNGPITRKNDEFNQIPEGIVDEAFETMYQNIDEETNHWYDAGVKDAHRDARQYPNREVKKLNPRTRLKTIQDRRARHPEEVEQYSLGYRSVKQGVAEDKENHNSKLDEILYKLCNIVKKEIKEKTGEHAVAACIIDPDNRIVAKTSKDKHGRWIHAEHNAIDTYENKYGEVPEGSIIVTTLSPCNEYDDKTSDERFGESCTDYINSKGIKKVYCGYMDPTQDNYNREFNVIETSDNDLRQQCKQFADTFLKTNIDEAFDQPYSFQWKVGEFGDYNAYTKLPDGSTLSIMFNDDGIDDKAYSVEFWRNNSQETTGDGDSQRVFATVLHAIQEFLTKEQPNFISFIGAKGETGEGKNSRVNLYSKLLQRYATKWGYKLKDVFDSNDSVEFDLVKIKQGVAEAFDTPLPITWEKGMHGDIDALAKLPDGTNLSIMFNKQDNIKPDDKTWMVEFYRNNSQEVTGEGDAQKVFSTVLVAIQQFIKKYKPLKIYFSASKEIDPSINYGPDDVVPNPESRAKLYDRMVLRYAKSWGYKFFRADNGDLVMYQLSRIPKQKAVGENQTMQYASEKTPPVSPYAGVKDNQYRGGISEAIADNYLYHSIESIETFRKIINTGEIKPKTPIEYEEDDIEMPVISASRNQYYRFPYGGGNIQFVIDKDALKHSGFKVKPYSYAQHYTPTKSTSKNELHKQETEEQIFPFKGHGIPVKQPYIVGIQINPKFKDTPELEEIQKLSKSVNIPVSFMKTATKPVAKKVDIKLTPKFDPNRFVISPATGATKQYFPMMMYDKETKHTYGLDADYTNAQINDRLKNVTEASGYIPSEKQKNDPRFKTALTVDVHPDSIKKNAKAFYWNTSRAGIPPTAKANGKIY